jgi:hypothetical protein
MTTPIIAPVTYCSCGCGIPVTTPDGTLLPAEQLADNFVFDYDGSLDYIEIYHRAHVHGRRLTDKDKALYTALAPRYEVTVEHPTVTLRTQLDLPSARFAVHTAVAAGQVVTCRPLGPEDPVVAGIQREAVLTQREGVAALRRAGFPAKAARAFYNRHED